MGLVRSAFILCLSLSLGGCFSKSEKQIEAREVATAESKPNPNIPLAPAAKPVKKDASDKDKSLVVLTRYFSQADSLHKEAWWVLTSEKRPAGKSPFGKVERALLTSANIKLSNKSLFRCDRYVVKRSVSPAGFPQKFEVFEKCSDKAEAKQLADITFVKLQEAQVDFYTQNLEEVLGLGPTVLGKHIECTLKGNDSGVLTALQCKNWSQDRTKEQMVRLDTYDYQKDAKNMIKLRGKVYENLSDTRKIEADVPLEGKITVTETELYAPEVKATPTPTPAGKKNAQGQNAPGAAGPQNPATQGELGAAESGVVRGQGAPDTPAVDPDLIQGRMQQQGPLLPGPNQPPVQGHESVESAADQGWPVDENGNPIVPEEQQMQQQQQQPQQGPQDQNMYDPESPVVSPQIPPQIQAPAPPPTQSQPQGAPHGR